MRRSLLDRVRFRRSARALLADLATSAWHAADARLEARMVMLLSSIGEMSIVDFAPAAEDDDPASFEIVDGVAVLPLRGELFPEVPWFYELFGIEATSTRVFREQLVRAVDDAAVQSILLAVDSPGGRVDGTAAAAQAVFDARSAKRVHAHAEGYCTSAAYYIASQAHEISSDEGAIHGSIGTIFPFYDFSQMFENEGIRPRMVRSSPLKSAPRRGEELTDAVLAPYQAIVDEETARFVAAVRRGRGLSDEQWEAVGDPGRVLTASTAVDLGLVDRIDTLDAALAAAAATESAPADDEDDAPEVAPQEEQAMPEKTNEQLEAEIAELKAKLETKSTADAGAGAELEAKLAAEKKAREAAEAKAAAFEATTEATKAEQKKSMIDDAAKAGQITAQNREAVEAYAEKVDAEQLGTFIKALPVVTRPAAMGVAEDQGGKSGMSPEEREDLEAIAQHLGVHVDEVDPAKGKKAFSLAAYARKREAENKAGGSVRIINE